MVMILQASLRLHACVPNAEYNCCRKVFHHKLEKVNCVQLYGIPQAAMQLSELVIERSYGKTMVNNFFMREVSQHHQISTENYSKYDNGTTRICFVPGKFGRSGKSVLS